MVEVVMFGAQTNSSENSIRFYIEIDEFLSFSDVGVCATEKSFVAFPNIPAPDQDMLSKA